MMNTVSKHGTLWVLLLACSEPVANAQGEVFADVARVVSTQAILETTRQPVTRRHCEPQGRQPAGGLRQDGGSASRLIASIQAELKLRDQLSRSVRCRQVREWELREQVIGYRVWYEYQGRTLVRQMAYDPGDRVRVVVDLQPVH